MAKVLRKAGRDDAEGLSSPGEIPNPGGGRTSNVPGWCIYKVVGSVKRKLVVGPGFCFAMKRWPGSTTHLFDPAWGPWWLFL